MSRTKDWTVTTDFDDVLIRKDGNRRITKSSFAAAISSTLQNQENFIKSTSTVNQFKVATTATNYTASDTDGLIQIDCSGGSRTVALPAAVTLWDSVNSVSNIIIVKRSDTHATNTCVINPDGAETIDGAASITLSGTNLPFVWIYTDGTNLYTIG